MNNKKVYEDKIKPLSSLFINYYGNEYTDKINDNFNNLVYNFNDLFSSSYDVIDNNPNMFKGLFDNYGYIKAKEEFNKLFNKYLDIIINYLKTTYNIDISDNYHIFFDNYYCTKAIDCIINDDKKLYEFSIKNHISTDNIQEIYKAVHAYKINFYKDLLNISYFKNIYKSLNCNFKVYFNIVVAILERDPFLSRFKDKDNNIRNYLYYPYISLIKHTYDIDTGLLHELIHLTESNETKDKELRIGLHCQNKNKYVNEIRTDLLAIRLKELLNKKILETRDIEYRSLYLKIFREYAYFFNEYEKVLSKIAISGDLDKLTYLFSNDWNDFSKRIDDLYYEVIKEMKLHDGEKNIKVSFNTSKIHSLINSMENNTHNKILVL